jgi:hypothetical protein
MLERQTNLSLRSQALDVWRGCSDNPVYRHIYPGEGLGQLEPLNICTGYKHLANQSFELEPLALIFILVS